MQALQRTRRVPGPLLLLMVIWVLTGTAVRAHDPGLSSLEVNVNDGTVSMALSVAAADVAVIAPTGEARLKLRELAAEAIRLSADNEALRSTVHDVSMQAAEVRVELSFDLPSAGHARRLTVTSEVPKRIGRGHRQLVVVSVDRNVRNETLLDSNSGPVTISLDATQVSAGHLLLLAMMAMSGGSWIIKRLRTKPAPTDGL